MDIEATAQALVAEPISEPVVTSETTDTEPDYSALFDKITDGDPVEDTEPAPPEATEAPKEQPPAPEAVEAPTDVPVALRKHWGAIPEDARDAVLSSQREMSRKLSDMGRQVQGISPIREALVTAVRDNPALANMRPEDVASDVMELARYSAGFKAKPLETFLGLAQKHGMIDALRQAFSGQPQAAQGTAEMQKQIGALQQQLARAADPEFIREQVSAVTFENRVMSDVQAFAETQQHWGEVEEYLPKVIPLVRDAMPDAPQKDILAKAYDLALNTYRPDLKAPVKAAVEAAAKPDPERTQAAIQAKSVNIPAKVSGKPREMTEEEIYSAAYDRAAKK